MTEDQLVQSNYLGHNSDQPIYRITRVEHLEKDAANHSLTLRRIIGWEDPHEGSFFRRSVLLSETGERVGLGNLAKDWFGACWSRIHESDAMWRIYNPDGHSVRLETTPRELMEALFRCRLPIDPGFSDYARLSLYMGDVSYHEGNAFEQLMAESVSQFLDDAGRGMAQRMILKREAFRHESEVRLLYHAHLNGGVDNGDAKLLSSNSEPHTLSKGEQENLPPLIHLPFDWSCIHSIMIGPLVREHAAAAIRRTLESALPGVPISISQLYGDPNYSGVL